MRVGAGEEGRDGGWLMLSRRRVGGLEVNAIVCSRNSGLFSGGREIDVAAAVVLRATRQSSISNNKGP